MERLGEFLTMEGYGAFVWPAYAIAIGVMLAMAAHAVIARRRLQRQLAELQAERREGERREGGGTGA